MEMLEVKKVLYRKVDIVSRARKFSRSFATHDRNIDIQVRRVACQACGTTGNFIPSERLH
jgi:hypothetical protein